MSNNQLINRCKRGDEEAFAELLTENYDAIFQTAWRWCGDIPNAEDITQNVCLKLVKSITKFDFKSSFTTWLYRLTINSAKDFYKSPTQHNQREESHDDLARLSTIEAIDENRLHARRMLEKIAILPTDLADTLLLVFVRGLTHAQIGTLMNVKESTISWRVHEARKQLKGLCESKPNHKPTENMIAGGAT